jgi:hypothetical protein
MTKPDNYSWIEDPPMDDPRSKEEALIADSCHTLMEQKTMGVVVGGEEPGTPGRKIGVAMAVMPWNRRLFKKRHSALVKCVCSIVEPDAHVIVVAMPLKILWAMVVLRILKKDKIPRNKPVGVADVRP